MRVVFALVCALGLGTAGLAGERPKDFGKQWVRNHPLTLMALLLDSDTYDPAWYKELNLTAALIWKGREGLFEKSAANGMPWHYYALPNLKKTKDAADDYDALAQERMDLARSFHDKYAGGAGFLIWDEPRHPAFPAMAQAMAWFRETFPEMLGYSNLYSGGAPAGKYYDTEPDAEGNYTAPPVPYGYEQYLREYLDTCHPDLLMVDPYPFVDYETCDDVTWTATRYFHTLEAVRKAALEASLPYWTFVQSFGNGGSYYCPSESDLRMQVFSSLAYGFTGLAYFLYHAPTYPCALLCADGTPSPLFHVVSQVNREVQHLGPALRSLTSTDVRYVPGLRYLDGRNVPNPLPVGVTAYDDAAGKVCGIASIEVKGVAESRNALIGFFRDDAGGAYFMLVNLRHARGVAADEMIVPVQLSFEPSVQTLYRLSRETGGPEAVTIADGKLELRLPGGTGDLFKVGDGKFPGVEGVERWDSRDCK
ncbi:MAG TPA: hypothetical protein VM221_03065 [Armatimonadota bacterium]|nr:hypothetical protein [Armatimonadota bacterium]